MTHKSSCNTNVNLQQLAANGCRADCGGNGKAGMHGAFSIGLTSFRPPEID
jgi:hypothetical protein